MRKPYVKDRRVARNLGIVALVAGSLLLWDAYENRGKGRPFVLKFLPV